LQELLRALLWAKYDITLDDPLMKNFVHELSMQLSIVWLYKIADLLYKHEMQFLKSLSQAAFLEHILLQMVLKKSDQQQKFMINDDDRGISKDSLLLDDKKKTDKTVIADDQRVESSKLLISKKTQPEIKTDDKKSSGEIDDSAANNLQMVMWQQFLASIQKNVDPIVTTIFTQAQVDFSDVKKIVCRFASHQLFFNDLLDDQAMIWRAQFTTLFGSSTELIIEFSLKENMPVMAGLESIRIKKNNLRNDDDLRSGESSNSVVQNTNQDTMYKKNNSKILKKNHTSIDISDQKKWPKVNLILRYVPGTVTRIASQEDL
jgi:hypothetical protein